MSNETDLGLGRTSFSCEDPSVVTFIPKNYATKSNFRKRCRLCCDNEIGPGQKMRKKHEQITKSGSSMLFFHMFAALLTNLRFMLKTMPRYVPRLAVTFTVYGVILIFASVFF